MSNPLLIALSASDTTITVTGTITFPVNGGTIQIESEKISYRSCSADQFFGCTRARGGTSAATHAAGKAVTLIESPQPSLKLGSDVVVLKFAGVPVAGTAGTGSNVAAKGSLCIDTTNGTLYQNTNTLASPTWTLFQAGTDLGITALTGDVTASGTGSVAATIANSAVTDAKIATVSASKLTGALPAIDGSALTGLPSPTIGAPIPDLVYVSATTASIKQNTTTTDMTSIKFFDGTVKSVTEDLGATPKIRLLDLAVDAEWTTGTEQSGKYPSSTLANGSWLIVYAVKSLINASKFVLVARTLEPVVANVTTLNSNFGTGSWVPVGILKAGVNGSLDTNLVAFRQDGDYVAFVNQFNDGSNNICGAVVATGTGTSGTFAGTAGTDADKIPNSVSEVLWTVDHGSATGFIAISDPTSATSKLLTNVYPTNSVVQCMGHGRQGLKVEAADSALWNIAVSTFRIGFLSRSSAVLL